VYNYVVLSSWIILIYILLGIYAYKADKNNSLNKAFLIYNTTLALASLCNMYMHITYNNDAYWFWYKLDVFFWCINAGYSLNLSLIITKDKKIKERKWAYPLIYIPVPIITIYEFFFMRSFQQNNIVLYSIFTVVEYIYLFVFPASGGLIVWLWSRKVKTLRERKQGRLIASAAFANMILSLSNTLAIYIFGFTDMPDITHILSFGFDLVIWYAILKYRLLSIKSLVSAEDVISKVTDMIIIIDEYENIISVNSTCEKALGYKLSELVGKNINTIISPWKEITYYKEEFPAEINSAILYCKTKNSKDLPIRIQVSEVIDNVGEKVGSVVICQDMTLIENLNQEIEKHRKNEDKLNYLSLHDPLTGLYNRRQFEYELQKLESENQVAIGIVICDVDGLKLVNDIMGHNEGDKLLIRCAGIITKAFEGYGNVFRTGGDEFAVIVPKADIREIKERKKHINEYIQKLNNEYTGFYMSISIGYAVYRGMGNNIVEVYKEADNMMYHEKLYNARTTKKAMIRGFMKMLEQKDFVAQGHLKRINDLVVIAGKKLGLSDSKITNLRMLAKFHDIGKVGISTEILNKKGPLSNSEKVEMQRHSEIGYRIAKSIPELSGIADLILKHHERWDGKGYPLGISRTEIPLECRIFSIIDAYDAMISKRPYKKIMNYDEIVSELRKNAGTQFDPQLVEELLDITNSRNTPENTTGKPQLKEV